MSPSPPGESVVVVVLHPSCSPGIGDAVARVPGVRLLRPHTEPEVLEALGETGVLLTHRHGWREEYFDHGLAWVQSQGSGHEDFSVEEFRRRGVVLTTGRGLHSVCAEHAIGLLLCLLRGTQRAVRNMDRQRWERFVPDELSGQTVAIVGLGTIGEAVARRLEGWEVRRIGVTRSPVSYEGVVEDVRPLGGLVAAASEASILVVAIRSVPETQGLVSSEVLDALGRGWLVNVARGAVVDQPALVERLADGRLAGAGLDVFATEPLPPDSPLWRLPNVVCTPHMAGESPSHPERFARLFAENLRAYRGEGPWRNRLT